MIASSLNKHINHKFKIGELPQFIIYEYFEIEKSNKLEFFTDAVLKITDFNSINHPDLLLISPTEGSYKVDDGNLQDMTRFLSHTPLQSEKKWLVWTESELLTTAIFNKLLKTLEEPPPFLQILFFHEAHSHLLPTIKSRAIVFREKRLNQKLETETPFFSLPEASAYSKAQEFSETEEKILINLLTNNISTYAQSQNFINEFKALEKNRNFHQTNAHRLFRYLTLKNHS